MPRRATPLPGQLTLAAADTSRLQPGYFDEPGNSFPGGRTDRAGSNVSAGLIDRDGSILVALPPNTAHLGNLEILANPLLALFCSTKCPGRLIIQTYDLARALRDAGLTVISGFHTPMERECLDLLLRGSQPIVICPARGIATMRVPPAWKQPLVDNRLLILSPFAAKYRRPTRDLAAARNTFAASLAARVVITHAAPGGHTEHLARTLLSQGKLVLTIDDPANANLLTIGAHTLRSTRALTPLTN